MMSSKYINSSDMPAHKEILTRILDIGLQFKCRDRVVSGDTDATDFDKLMAKVYEEEIPRGGIEVEKLLDKFETELIPFCTNWASPYAMAFNDNGNSLAGIAGDVLATLLNQNIINWRPCAPIGTVIEMTVLNWLRKLVGYPCAQKLLHPANVAGMVTSGGVASNTISMLIAREKALPDTMRKGIEKATDYFVIVPNGIDHYSSRLSASWIGLGESNVLRCPTTNFMYDLPKLIELLEQQKKIGRKPIMLVCYAGDSRSMTCDNFVQLRKICDDYQIWMHIDGCQGTQLIFSRRLKKEKLQGMELADSITMDPHKILNLPYSISVLLIKNTENMELIRRAEDIITGEEHSFGQLTPFYGSRAFMSLKLYFLFKNLGLNGLEEVIERRCHMAEIVSEEIAKHSSLIQINNQVDINSVMFMYFPKEILKHLSCLPSKEAKVEAVTFMNNINTRIQAKLFNDGDVWLHTFLIPDLSNALMLADDTRPDLRPLRFMSGNPNLKCEHILYMIKRVVEEGDNLIKCDLENISPKHPLHQIAPALQAVALKSVQPKLESSKPVVNGAVNGINNGVVNGINNGTVNGIDNGTVNGTENGVPDKGLSLRNSTSAIADNYFLPRDEFCKRKTQLMLEIRSFCCKEFAELNEAYFVVVYGSYAYQFVKAKSDLDIVFFCADEYCTKERQSRVINFVEQLHDKYNLKKDNEIPYEAKMLLSFSFLKSACQGDGIATTTSDGQTIWDIPKIQKTIEYLTSKELLLRFFNGMFVNQNFLVCGNVGLYEKCKALAARNVVRAVLSMNNRKTINSFTLTKDFCLSPRKDFGDYFLGFSDREPFTSHLLEILEHTLASMNLQQTYDASATTYYIQSADLSREYFN